MNKPMTKAARRRHIDTGGQECCPFCGAEYEANVDVEPFDVSEEGEVEQAAQCNQCGRAWVDTFTLSRVREIAKETP